MRFRTLFIAAPLFLLAAQTVRAQDAANDADKATRSKLKADLRNLVTAQEKYYYEHASYADQIESLAFHASAGSQVSLVATQNNAWAGVASDPSWTGKSCVIFINLAKKYRPATAQDKRVGEVNEEGKPLCDGDPPPEK